MDCRVVFSLRDVRLVMVVATGIQNVSTREKLRLTKAMGMNVRRKNL